MGAENIAPYHNSQIQLRQRLNLQPWTTMQFIKEVTNLDPSNRDWLQLARWQRGQPFWKVIQDKPKLNAFFFQCASNRVGRPFLNVRFFLLWCVENMEFGVVFHDAQKFLGNFVLLLETGVRFIICFFGRAII
jgi:hypothetical protein